LKIYKVLRDFTEEISDIKISPNGLIMAVGAHDNRILLYKVPSF
jgi:hypothetical protein